MPTESPSDSKFEIGHILFIDIVGYSKLHLNQQRHLVELLNRVVRDSGEFQNADAAGKLVRLPTGDGMALVFYNHPEAPVECALEISRALREQPELHVRMGIHSGPVSSVLDVNERRNIAGAGINTAQRVMDCGDAGHILLSKRTAEDLAHTGKWNGFVHEIGECEVKHGLSLSIANFYHDGVGNSELPSRLKQAREREAAARRAARIRQRKKVGAISGAVLLIAVSISVWLMIRSSASSLISKSIAVLPFENLSDDKANAYLADGVQDEILTDLTKVADLKVISRRSVQQYRDAKQTNREIGKALGVAHVLEGTVRKVADQIHVTAQLIDTRTETQIWAEKYDRDIADVVQIQSDISQAIVTQLKAALSAVEKATIEAKPTQDKEAYDLYLRAHALVYGPNGIWASVAQENAAKAIPLLESAIARDPTFALAYSLLGEAHLATDQPGERLATAKKAYDAALSIAPNLPEVHLALAHYYSEGVEDQAAAEKEINIAAAGLPGQADVFQLRSQLEQNRGHWKNALRDAEKALQLNPRDDVQAFSLILLKIDLRRYDEAGKLADHFIATTAQQSIAPFCRAKSYIAIARGDAKSAMAALDASPYRNSAPWVLSQLIAHVFVLQRNYSKAEEILQTVEETVKARGAAPKAAPSGDPFFGRGLSLERLGRIARFRGDAQQARRYFEEARAHFADWLVKNPEPNGWRDSHAAAYIAEIDAALGRKEDAIREGREAATAWPVKRDAIVGADIRRLLAVVYMWAGQRDAALDQLAETANLPELVGAASSAGGTSAGELKLNPLWEELRNDPRFDKIVAEAAKPVKLE
jgi:TolB-like protein/Tfp pilus assembly protein PilF